MVVNIDETLCPQFFNGEKLRRPQTGGIGTVHRDKGIKGIEFVFWKITEISGKKFCVTVGDRPRNEDFSFFARRLKKILQAERGSQCITVRTLMGEDQNIF